MNKVVRLGRTRIYDDVNADVYAHVEFDGKRLSITGVEGPQKNGNTLGGAGQIEKPEKMIDYAPGWDAETVDRFFETWRRWHLNDMRAGCEHQRAASTDKQVEVVTYRINSEAHRIRREAETEAHSAAIEGRIANLSEAGRFMIGPDWFRDRFAPVDADSPLSGLYDVEKREIKRISWVSPTEHPEGLLGRPCEVCGYKYGTAWLHEDVPGDVIEWLESLPETDKTPAWV